MITAIKIVFALFMGIVVGFIFDTHRIVKDISSRLGEIEKTNEHLREMQKINDMRVDVCTEILLNRIKKDKGDEE